MCGGTALIDAGLEPDSAPASPLPGARAQRLAAGEAGAFEQLVALHQHRITRLVNRLLGWRGDVEDVVQEVFLAALLHQGRFRGESSVSTWLTAIALNKCRSHQRRLRVLWRRFVQDPPDDSDAAGRATPAGGAMEETETSARVRGAVRSLPPRDREVVVLRYFDELALDDIAALTGQSKNAVEVRLHRARAKLAGALRDVAGEGRQ